MYSYFSLNQSLSPSATFLLHILFLTGVGEDLSSYAPFFIFSFLNVEKREQPFEPIWDITLFSYVFIFDKQFD